MTDIREALRREFESRDLRVASDTFASRGELYVMGENDLARALFEFKSSAREAFDTMYQGSWTEGLPPLFAVLPVEAAEEDSFEILEQARIHPLLYKTGGPGVVFLDLDAALEHLTR